MKYKGKSEEKAKLIDRFAIAFFSGILAFFTVLVIWAILAGANLGGAFVVALSFKWVFGFTLFMSRVRVLFTRKFISKYIRVYLESYLLSGALTCAR